MAGVQSNYVVACCSLLNLATILLFLISLASPLTGYGIAERNKREIPRVEDLPQIKPPIMARKGDQKLPNPGWTHCIKYLKADVRWRSIRSVNLKKLQTTQFQCSWFIESEVPGTQVRIAFERMDLGNVNQQGVCAQQFLELFDIAAGKSQGRFCGERRLGDYVTVGQRVRIDIQGEEQLVEKVRSAAEPPFIISYKLVREPAGFRINQQKTNVALRNKVKQTVGSGLSKTTIYGSKNQPGKTGKNGAENENEASGTSLSLWQIVIIVVVCTAFIACVIGVLIKRKIFDKKKKKEYLDIENNDISLFSVGSSFDEKKLPGLTTVSQKSEKKDPDDGKKKTSKQGKSQGIPRAYSGPGGQALKANKTKRHISHDDARDYENVNNGWAEIIGQEAITITGHETNTILPRKTQSASSYVPPVPGTLKQVSNEAPEAVADDTPSNRPSQRPRGPTTDKKTNKKVRRSKSHSGAVQKKRKTSETDLNKNPIKHKSTHKHTEGDSKRTRRKENVTRDVTRKNDVKGDVSRKNGAKRDTRKDGVKHEVTSKKDDPKNEEMPEDDTPLSRAKKVPKKRKSHSTNENGKKHHSGSKHQKKKTDGDKKKEAEKKNPKVDDKLAKPSSKSAQHKTSAARRKTVSSAHKKTSTTGKRDTGKAEASANGHSKHRSRKPHSKGKHDRPDAKKRKSDNPTRENP